MSAFVLGFLDTEMNYRSTTDEVVDAIKIVKEHIIKKFWTSQKEVIMKQQNVNDLIQLMYILHCVVHENTVIHKTLFCS